MTKERCNLSEIKTELISAVICSTKELWVSVHKAQQGKSVNVPNTKGERTMSSLE